MPRSVRVGPSSVNGVPRPRCARTHLRRAVDPGASADPEGLTAGVRPRARPYERAADLRICPAPYAKREYVWSAMPGRLIRPSPSIRDRLKSQRAGLRSRSQNQSWCRSRYRPEFGKLSVAYSFPSRPNASPITRLDPTRLKSFVAAPVAGSMR